MQCLAVANLPEGPNWEYETLDATAAEIVAAVRKQGLEGVIAKRRDSRYQPAPGGVRRSSERPIFHLPRKGWQYLLSTR
jgi:hypothetical protein